MRETPTDQRAVVIEREARPERAWLATRAPVLLVQVDHAREELLRFDDVARLSQRHFAVAGVLAHCAPDLIARVAAEGGEKIATLGANVFRGNEVVRLVPPHATGEA